MIVLKKLKEDAKRGVQKHSVSWAIIYTMAGVLIET